MAATYSFHPEALFEYAEGASDTTTHASNRGAASPNEYQSPLDTESAGSTALQGLTVFLIGNLGLRFAPTQAVTGRAFSPVISRRIRIE